MRYLDYSKDRLGTTAGWLDPMTAKRHAFEHEREVRLVRWQMADTLAQLSTNALLQPKPPLVRGYTMSWDAERALIGVVVSPYAPEWYRDAVQSVAAKFAPVLADRIAWSELRADPHY